MARVDRIKEEIGSLKAPFGPLAVIDASLPGWLAKSYAKSNSVIVAAATIAFVMVSSGIFQINHIAYCRFDGLEQN